MFDSSYNIPKLLNAIFFLKNAEKDNGKTLIFIDEIQNSPNAIVTLRYLYEEAKHLYFIAAGSLLESLIDNTISFPVGRVEYMPVRPCSFEEFLLASDENKSLEIIQSGIVPDYAHNKLSELFKTYTMIGGMPEIVNEYLKSDDLKRLDKIYDQLIVSYQDDVEKYARNDTNDKIIRHIINSSFQYSGTRIKFANFGKSSYRSREMGEAFRMMEKTMLLQLVYPVTSTKLPMEEKTAFSPKLLMLDTGLVNYSAGLQKSLITSNNIDETYLGKIAEHIVGQELLSISPSVRSKLNFWVPSKPNSQAELDYVIPWNDLLIPVEVKSGATGTLRSLFSFVDKAPHNIGIRIYSGTCKIEKTQTIKGKKFLLVNLPFYLITQIKAILNSLNI
jgi:hypothetical protein